LKRRQSLKVTGIRTDASPQEPINVAIRSNQETLSMNSLHFPGSNGMLSLLTEIDPQTETINRTMHLEASVDGRSVLLVALDLRKLGSQREWRVEITPEELIALIRAHGTEVSGYLVDFEIQVP